MQLGRVIGTVVATRISEGLRGQKLLLVQPVDHVGKVREPPLVAVDTVRAGEGDLVHFVTSREAAQALEDDFVPVDAAIVGMVDAVDVAPEASSAAPRPRARGAKRR